MLARVHHLIISIKTDMLKQQELKNNHKRRVIKYYITVKWLYIVAIPINKMLPKMFTGSHSELVTRNVHTD